MNTPSFANCKVNFLASNRRGFTLIELLVVIAIIAIPTRTLLAALGKAKQGAQGTDTPEIQADRRAGGMTLLVSRCRASQDTI